MTRPSASADDTEVDVRFEAIQAGTRVRVHQYLRPDGDPERAFLFWPRIIWMFVPWCEDRDRAQHRPTELARVHVALCYQDPTAAARWLARVFMLTSPAARIPEEGEQPSWIELRVGNVPILLFRLDPPRPPERQVNHAVWVFVDDLDGHLAHATAPDAKIISEIRQHGYRAYEAADLEGHRWTFAQARPAMV